MKNNIEIAEEHLNKLVAECGYKLKQISKVAAMQAILHHHDMVAAAAPNRGSQSRI